MVTIEPCYCLSDWSCALRSSLLFSKQLKDRKIGQELNYQGMFRELKQIICDL